MSGYCKLAAGGYKSASVFILSCHCTRRRRLLNLILYLVTSSSFKCIAHPAELSILLKSFHKHHQREECFSIGMSSRES